MNNEFPSGKAEMTLTGPVGGLEAVTTKLAEADQPIVGIVCHPNPLFGGTMNNKVVTTVARTFERLGLATVRFNYRGVGHSEGEYGEVVGECEDLRAVISWVKRVLPDYQLWLAGFSFGSYIAASLANQIEVDQLVSIAPPVHLHDFTQLTQIRCPWLVVQGDLDEVVPFEQVSEWANHSVVPFKFDVMEGARHFFHGRLIELKKLLEKELGPFIK